MPRDPIDRLRVEMEELFNDLWQVPRFARGQGGFRPQIDCYRTERPAAFHVIVELAGVDPAKIQVFADEGTLIVSGERRRPRCAGRIYQQMEIDYGRFTRQVALGADIDVEASKATYKRGVLTIVLPLAKKPASAERIEIPVSGRSRR
ncbi:MAG: Hsp20/alpha crystallin family protein [Actinobacteria bacterium]|jgi:HSP20 family protein|nr:MAG: Hsp20/alpha crystallin family protein [Actinomycetota bacterium]